MTYTLIAHTEVGAGGTANITFSSIPALYSDLLIVSNIRTAGASLNNDPINVTFNGDTATNYSTTVLSGTGTTSSSTRTSTVAQIATTQAPGASAATSYWGSGILTIPEYRNTSHFKQILFTGSQEGNNFTSGTWNLAMVAGMWRSTAAITSIRLIANSGANIVQHSSATLYGLTKA